MDDAILLQTISLYSLPDCISLLASFAPDLLRKIADDVRFHPEDPETLKKAQRAVYDAILRERILN